MTVDEFVKGIYEEKESLLRTYLDPASGSIVAESIDQLEVPATVKAELRAILDDALSEMCFSILLGLDGESQLGGRQEFYRIYAESGFQLAGDGMHSEDDISSAAFRYFQGEDED